MEEEKFLDLLVLETAHVSKINQPQDFLRLDVDVQKGYIMKALEPKILANLPDTFYVFTPNDGFRYVKNGTHVSEENHNGLIRAISTERIAQIETEVDVKDNRRRFLETIADMSKSAQTTKEISVLFFNRDAQTKFCSEGAKRGFGLLRTEGLTVPNYGEVKCYVYAIMSDTNN